MELGESMMIPSVGGPSAWRVATYPPPIGAEVGDWWYVSVEEGPPATGTHEHVAIGADG